MYQKNGQQSVVLSRTVAPRVVFFGKLLCTLELNGDVYGISGYVEKLILAEEPGNFSI